VSSISAYPDTFFISHYYCPVGSCPEFQNLASEVDYVCNDLQKRKFLVTFPLNSCLTDARILDWIHQVEHRSNSCIFLTFSAITPILLVTVLLDGTAFISLEAFCLSIIQGLFGKITLFILGN
jgi:hypothetical protein